MNTEQFLKKHGLDFEVSLKPLACLKNEKEENLETPQPTNLKKFSASVKEGSETLFGIVNNDFSPIQNKRVIDLLSKFIRDGDEKNYKFSSKKMGATNSLLILNPEQVEAVNEGDNIQSGIHVSWKFNSGSGGVSFSPFFRRLICDNGMISDCISNSSINLFRETKEGYERPEFADEFLEKFVSLKRSTKEALVKDAQTFKEWIGVKVSDEVALNGAEEVFKINKLEAARKKIRTEDEKTLEKLFKKLNRAKAHKEIWFSRFKSQPDNKDNLWGLYNSFTAWFSHGLRTHEAKMVTLDGVPRAIENNESKVGLRASLKVCKGLFNETVRV